MGGPFSMNTSISKIFISCLLGVSLLISYSFAAPLNPTGLRVVSYFDDIPGIEWSSINKFYYVLESASGNNNGSNWHNAFTTLPEVLERGAAYFIGDGTYTRYLFNDLEFGESYIYIIKATEEHHGSDLYWQPSYGDGIANFAPSQEGIFEPFEFLTGYYFFDGLNNRGFKISGDYTGAAVSIRASHITFKNCDIDGMVPEGANSHTEGSCGGILIMKSTRESISDVSVYRCLIHNIADDGLEAAHVDNLVFGYNEIYNLWGLGTDGPNGTGPCYNGHSDALELNDIDSSIIKSNFIHDIHGTSGLIFLGGTSGTDPSENLIFLNNIFYIFDHSGFIGYFQGVHNFRVYNNVFWGRNVGGKYGGISIGHDVQALEMKNNIIHSLNFSHLGAAYDPTIHTGDYNCFGISTGEYSENVHDIIQPDPQFVNIGRIGESKSENPLIEDFRLQVDSDCLNAGTTLSDEFKIDIRGVIRPTDETWDIGACETH